MKLFLQTELFSLHNHYIQLHFYSFYRLKKDFKQLLEGAGYVTPGKQLSEVRVLFMGRDCFELLSEHDCQQIYDNHQKEIIERAKHNFQELLLENADLFYHFKSIEPSGTITQDDIKEITDVLQDDSRYKMLDRLDQDRKLMLFQHLGFIHCPIREHCPAFPNCIDSVVERIISTKKSQRWVFLIIFYCRRSANLLLLRNLFIAKALRSIFSLNAFRK